MTRRPAAGRAAFRWHTVVKVGGSLGRRPARLRQLLRALAIRARREHILLLPGGGRFADLVRGEHRRLGLSAPVAHGMALLAMDQFGLALADLHPGVRAVATLAAARRVARDGGLPVLLASSLAGRAPGLERSFRLTSDAIAAWLAGRMRARRLVLLKSVPGLDLRLGDRGAARAAARRGLVDPLFAAMMPEGIEVALLDGRSRLAPRWPAVAGPSITSATPRLTPKAPPIRFGEPRGGRRQARRRAPESRGTPRAGAG